MSVRTVGALLAVSGCGLLSVDVPSLDGGIDHGVDAFVALDTSLVDDVAADVAPNPCVGTVLASGGDPLGTMNAPAIDDAYVYWLQGNGPPATGYRVPKIGGAAEQLCVTNGWEMLVDAKDLFWSDCPPSPNGSIVRANKDGSSPTQVGANVICPSALIADATTIFFESVTTMVSGQWTGLSRGLRHPTSLGSQRSAVTSRAYSRRRV